MLRYRLAMFGLILAASVGGTVLWGPGAFFLIWFVGGIAMLIWLSTLDDNHEDSNYPHQS